MIIASVVAVTYGCIVISLIKRDLNTFEVVFSLGKQLYLRIVMFNRIIKRYVKIVDCKVDKFCVTSFCDDFKINV